ncbi:ATP-binding protein [Streptomyces sp. PA03-6a]|nr:ATP-binding protein [Streptomyces sp. PA03-6a]
MERQPVQPGGREAGGPAEARRLHRPVQHADLPAVADVRRLLREALRSWGVPDLADTAELLTTELVTNALRHTDRGAVLTVTLLPGGDHRLRVEVRDFTTRHPRLRAPSDRRTSGRGLLLVQSLADAWGVRPDGDGTGKIVWFELDAGAC